MTFTGNIVLLVGGVGGAKLAYGLAQCVPPENLTIIVNTGDDFWHYGLRICPDLDTITYTLAGLVDKNNGWGVANDTTTTLDSLRQLGDEPWFRLGDKDLATHLFRTGLWQQGQRLTEITAKLTKSMGVKCTIRPMTDTPVATIVDTLEYGELPFQVYFVKHRWQPTLKGVGLAGIEQASLSPEVAEALEQADAIIIGPSNPWLSINPILAVPGMREAIAARDVPRIAVTPVIGGEAVKGPTTKIMNELSLPNTTETIANYYAEVINGFIFDERDNPPQLDHLHITAMDTLMTDDSRRITLAQTILRWLEVYK